MLSGAAAIAKVVVKAEAREDNWTVQEVGQEPQSGGHSKLQLLSLAWRWVVLDSTGWYWMVVDSTGWYIRYGSFTDLTGSQRLSPSQSSCKPQLFFLIL